MITKREHILNLWKFYSFIFIYVEVIGMKSDDLMATFRGKNIIPTDKKQDNTCCNLLNIIAAKNLIPDFSK